MKAHEGECGDLMALASHIIGAKPTSVVAGESFVTDRMGKYGNPQAHPASACAAPAHISNWAVGTLHHAFVSDPRSAAHACNHAACCHAAIHW